MACVHGKPACGAGSARTWLSIRAAGPNGVKLRLDRCKIACVARGGGQRAVAGPLAGEEQDTAYVAGMRLVAVDGMCLDVPPTAENGAEFGYPGNDAGPGPFPQVRVVAAGECGTRAVLGAELSPLSAGEQPLALTLPA